MTRLENSPSRNCIDHLECIVKPCLQLLYISFRVTDISCFVAFYLDLIYI